MTRKAFVIHLKPGQAQEYERRHNPIWPELQDVLKRHGVSHYSIFLREATGELFGSLEIEDEDRYRQIAETEVCQRWWRYMTEVLVSPGDGSPRAKEEPLREVFRLD